MNGPMERLKEHNEYRLERLGPIEMDERERESERETKTEEGSRVESPKHRTRANHSYSQVWNKGQTSDVS